jgi:hypothetical protein
MNTLETDMRRGIRNLAPLFAAVIAVALARVWFYEIYN